MNKSYKGTLQRRYTARNVQRYEKNLRIWENYSILTKNTHFFSEGVDIHGKQPRRKIISLLAGGYYDWKERRESSVKRRSTKEYDTEEDSTKEGNVQRGNPKENEIEKNDGQAF